MKDLSLIFDNKPTQWGLRGDPYMWEDLQKDFRGKFIEDADWYSVVGAVFHKFEEKARIPLTLGAQAYVAEYAHGGMSSGSISGDFWISRGIPILFENYRKLKAGYPVVTLCGSTKFKDEFMDIQKKLTLEGNIVISVGLFGHSGDSEVWENLDEGTMTRTKEMLDDMHKRKIDMADSIFVINVGGYIGYSTRSEIEYAKMQDKVVRYLEPIDEYPNESDVNMPQEYVMKSSIRIQKIGITKLTTDAIVNAANDRLWSGGGVCGAIFKEAGYEELTDACRTIGGCKTGNAVITPGFKLPAKYIIHAVGPVWHDGNQNEPKLLYSAYKQSLIVAKENGCHSIGFPLISAGIFGYPKDKAWRKAIQACQDFIKSNSDYPMEIVFAVLDDEIMELGMKTMSELSE